MKTVILSIVAMAVLLILAFSASVASAQEPDMAFLEDVTIPDDTVIEPGAVFTKTWKLKNTGGVDWLDYSLQFVSGEKMGGVPNDVAPVKTNGIVDVTVVFTAPVESGTYTSIWALVDEAGNQVGNPFFARIKVGDSLEPAEATRIAEMIQPFVAEMNEPFTLGDFEFRVVNVYRNEAVWGSGCKPCTLDDKVWAIMRFNVTNNGGQETRLSDHIGITVYDPETATFINESHDWGSVAFDALYAVPDMFGGILTIRSTIGAQFVDAAMVHVEPVPATAVSLQVVFVDIATGDTRSILLRPLKSKSEMRYEGEFINAPPRE